MPLAKSGADLGPDFRLTKLAVVSGTIVAEGLVIVRPPDTLTAVKQVRPCACTRVLMFHLLEGAKPPHAVS